MNTPPLTSARVTPQDLTRFCLEAMRLSGLNAEDARLTAEVLVTTDTLGTFTHGTRQLRGLLKNVRSGRIRPTPTKQWPPKGPPGPWSTPKTPCPPPSRTVRWNWPCTRPKQAGSAL